jgi:hypothetical protein
MLLEVMATINLRNHTLLKLKAQNLADIKVKIVPIVEANHHVMATNSTAIKLNQVIIKIKVFTR